MVFPTNLSTWTPWTDAASVVAVATGVAKMFDWFDGLISDESRVALWYYMADVPTDERIDSWGSVFPLLIDNIYGKRPWSLKFFFRSCISSIIATCVVAIIYFRFSSGYRPTDSLDFLLKSLLLGAFLANVLPDFVSLLLTRFIVKVIEKIPHPVAICLALLADTLWTTLISAASVLLGLAFFFGISVLILFYSSAHDASSVFEQPFDLLGSLLRGNVDLNNTLMFRHPLSIFFYSAFFTSLWLWLYVFSIFFIKIAHSVRPLWIRLLPYLDIEKKPMQAIGRIAGIMAGAGWAVILGIVWLVHRGH